jgi:hypothetical protein
MKKIVFFKFWEHSAYYKARNIRLQNKRIIMVCMNQKWGNCEKKFQRLKDIISLNSAKKRSIYPSQSSKKGHYWRIVGNEMLIKVNKYKKALDVSNKS